MAVYYASVGEQRGALTLMRFIFGMLTMLDGPQGLFVHAPDDRYIGKVVRLDSVEKEVAFFHSVAKRETARFERMTCQRAYLQPETQVVAKREDGRLWRGPVMDRFLQDNGSVGYEVRFLNDENEDIN